MVETICRRCEHRISVSVVVVAVVTRMIVVDRSITAADIVADRRSYIVAMSVVERVVVVKIVVIVVGCQISIVISVPVAVISVIVWMMVRPSPAVCESIVVIAVTIIVRAIVVTWPAPVVTHVNAYAPRRWTVIIPIEVGVERIVVTPTAIYICVESTKTGGVVIVIIVVFIIVRVVIGHVGVAGATSTC